MSSRKYVMGAHIVSTLRTLMRESGGVRAVLTVKQVAEVCGITKATARKYLRLLREFGEVAFVEKQLRGAETYQYVGEVE